MVWKILFTLLLIYIYLFYKIYLAKFLAVRKNFLILKRFLNARDALISKLLPELKKQIDIKKAILLIEERRENFESNYNNAIKSDVKLNAELKIVYSKINNLKLNELTKQLFNAILKSEIELKKLRKEYSEAVEKYNNNLINHKFVCLKLIKMKPLDTYSVVVKNN